MAGNRVLQFLPLLLIISSCAAVDSGVLVQSAEGFEPSTKPRPSSNIPKHINVATSLPAPKLELEEVTHTVVVFDVPVKELLFSLARDTGLNLDIDAGIDQLVSINAVEQPLERLLDRISELAGLRYQIEGNSLRISRDLPYLKNYTVDYLSIVRSSSGEVSVSTQISSTGQGAANGSGSTGNSSNTIVRSSSEHNFWLSLKDNINKILYVESDTPLGSETTNANIVLNQESGTLAIKATEKQHGEIKAFLSLVQLSAQRQVLIEATIAEVTLNDRYQAGIDWKLLNPENESKVTGEQTLTDIDLSSLPNFALSLSGIDIKNNELSATLRALETFGDVKVMSSPKVMAMNNQTAILKVVDNLIYFTIDVNVDTSAGAGASGGTLTTFETEVQSVPVGLVMSVTPFIDQKHQVILNVRPTISRVVSFVDDPNPALATANVVNKIPVIQVREVESILRVGSGDVAVIGGLMQDEIRKNTRGIPFIQSLPFVGSVFRYDDDQNSKTELVIFLKPTVITDASLSGDLKSFQRYAPPEVSR